MTADEAIARALHAAFPDTQTPGREWYDLGDERARFLAALSAAGFVVVPKAGVYWIAKEDGSIEPLAEKPAALRG